MISLLTILNLMPSRFLRNVKGLKFLLRNDLKRRSFFDEWARDSVIKEIRLRFKIETLYNLLDTFSNQLKELFKEFITVLQRFKILDLKFLLRCLLVNVTKRCPSWPICMHQTQRNTCRMYYPSLNLLSVVQAEDARRCHFGIS